MLPCMKRGETKADPEPGEPGSWLRLRTDTPMSFEAFKVFRDLGPARKQERVAEMLGKGKALISEWHTKHHWRLRVNAYDADQDRIALEKRNAMRPVVMDRHIGILQQFEAAVLRRMATIDPMELTPETTLRWMEVTLKMEQRLYGLDGEDTRGNVPLVVNINGRLLPPPTLTSVPSPERNAATDEPEIVPIRHRA